MVEHVDYIFNHVVQELCDPEAKLDVIGVAEGAMRVAEFLEKEENFKKWGGRMEAFAALATYYHAGDNKNEEFAHWLQEVCCPPLLPHIHERFTDIFCREDEHSLFPRNPAEY